MYKKQLTALYKVSVKTLNIWLKPFQNKIDPQLGRVYIPKQLKIIYDCLGEH